MALVISQVDNKQEVKGMMLDSEKIHILHMGFMGIWGLKNVLECLQTPNRHESFEFSCFVEKQFVSYYLVEEMGKELEGEESKTIRAKEIDVDNKVQSLLLWGM